MATMMPLLVIVGPTASGKTQLALDIAERYGGEIITADSRTIYRGLDIGTAKPSKAEQARVSHHLIDIMDPDQSFSAYEFQRLASETITDIRARNKLPILIGGTGLYIDSVIFNYDMQSVDVDLARREQLSQLSIEQLHTLITEHNFTMPENRLNKRHLVRAIEQKGINTTRQNKPIKNTIIVGITTDKSVLVERISKRAVQMFNQGIEPEAIAAAEQYGWEAPGLSGNIYRVVHNMVQGSCDRAQAIARCVALDRQLAKRQMTWFRRNPFIVWKPLGEIEEYIAQKLG